MATIHSPASIHDTNFLQYCTIFSRHTNKPIKIVYPVEYVRRTTASQFNRASKTGNRTQQKDLYPVKFEDHLTGVAFNVFRGMKILPKAAG